MPFNLIHLFKYPDEFTALYKMKFLQPGGSVNDISSFTNNHKLSDLQFCYAILNKVSRSFSTVICQLPTEIRDVICVFYLVLRGLDTIEDDFRIPAEKRKKLLLNFYQNSFDPQWTISGVGDSKDYQLLLENYQRVTSIFQGLKREYQEIISQTCQEMGAGMASFIGKEIHSVEDYNHYCHFVAGKVGIGLSKIFSVSGLEHEELQNETELSNSMGIFLQKTNIIRDYHEDLILNRKFWPQEIWGKYADTLGDLRYKEFDALACLNHMVTDAMKHAILCLKYLELIQNKMIFQFCAIPQVMAISTLVEIYNNAQLFYRNVKIRKGLAAKLILNTQNMNDVREVFLEMGNKMLKKASLKDSNFQLLVRYLCQVANPDKVRIKEEFL
ncbi:squalene synthase [Xanthovirga aplysinae]|uniref:squalene synthase n=1 Tax=Xanthovirga aplysinae TaxID=2529853 RepID=UPI0012BC2B9B|nr:squalene synthase [Xanthovirga aplysinae]MTI31607.1 squalene synthase [Xanthovirga aplysinae]